MPVNATRYLKTGGVDLDLGLKIYSGTFAEAWRNQPKLFRTNLPVIHMRGGINGAKSYQNLLFADTPIAEQDYLPGPELLGQDYALIESVVERDNYVVAHHWLPRDLLAAGGGTAHFDILARLGRSDARQVAMTIDKRLFITAALQARAAAVTKNTLTVHNGGNRVTRTGTTIVGAYPASTTGAANFRTDLRTLGRLQDIDNIPSENRYLWTHPVVREALLFDNTNQVFSKDFQDVMVNNVMMRVIGRIDGYTLVDYVNSTSTGGSLPDENITTGPTKYQGNFAAQASDGIVAAIALCEGPDGSAAVSMGTWESVQNVFVYVEDKMSFFVSSFILAGIGGFMPPCAGSVEVIL